MKIRTALLLTAGVLAGCATSTPDTSTDRSSAKALRAERRADTRHESASGASTIDGYKRDLAMRISDINSSKVYPGRPQALLRSVVVLRYSVDAQGNLLRSEIMRSNRDRETESTALASLRSAAPFPRPASHLVRHGKLELSETWLFNNDGRFQLRTIAQPQMDQ
ncbi:MAG TPA: TonB family protein [Noviherbaspirillum sp.]|uniref:energy transducer TonB family protein n=1 Tax=Noviherbaspirillum sp. TaxID=1926288 RepID=UPI002B4A15A6|nr:TonB family protein [Noviherbaspirillum sp.]HJV86448.1 TonB family protein [Noviherbaspirillum sp.]